MSQKERKNYTPEEKVSILRKHLLEGLQATIGVFELTSSAIFSIAPTSERTTTL